MVSLKKTSYHIVLYSIGNILLKIVGLFLLPVYTSVFDIYEFGMIGIIETTSFLLTTLLSLNLSSALVRWLSEDKEEIISEKSLEMNIEPIGKNHQTHINKLFYKEILNSECLLTRKDSSIVYTIFILNIVIIAGFSIITFPFLKQISQLLFRSDAFNILILLMFINIYIDILNRIPLNFLRVKEKPILYIISMILKSVITLGTIIILLKYTSLGILGVLIGSISGNLAFFLCTVPFLVKNIYIKKTQDNINKYFLRSEIPAILKYSFPLIFVGLGSVILNMGDRYILGLLKDLGQVGIYTLGFKVSSVVNMFVLQAVNLAVLPIAIKSFLSENGKLFLRQMMINLTVVLCFMFLFISIFSGDFLKLFTKSSDYLAANSIIPILLFAYIFEGLRIMYSYHLLYVKKTQWNAWLTLSSAFVNIVLNFIVIPVYGFVGAAFTTLLTSFITCIAYKIVAQKMIFVDYAQKKIRFVVIFTFLCFLIFKFLEIYIINKIILTSLIIILFMLVMYISKIVSFSANTMPPE
ncbi:MAG: oligosaccharide flippase family protein [Candidatus Cloacimonetes bacterium]|nr:oligosaccharide flippase family protein [Candidatus Cloacimonadota bacterium]